MATKKKKKVLKKTPKKTVKKKPAVKKPKQKAKAVKKKTVKKPAPKKPAPKRAPPAKAKVNVDYSKAITPLADRLVVRVVNGERVTAGGLIIPDTALLATGYLKAEVLAVGAGGKNKKGYLKPLDVKVGDTVLFAEYAGTKVEFNSEELQIIHESDVMGIVQK